MRIAKKIARTRIQKSEALCFMKYLSITAIIAIASHILLHLFTPLDVATIRSKPLIELVVPLAEKHKAAIIMIIERGTRRLVMANESFFLSLSERISK